MSELLDQTCRVAFSALIHDIGKFSQCAGQQFSQDFFVSSIKPLCPALEEEFSLASDNASQSLQQAIVLEADRVARGSLEKSSNDKGIFAKSRLLTLFEQIDVSENKSPADKRLNYRYPLVPMSVQSIFPDKDENVTSSDEQKAKALWDGFLDGLKKIPEGHKQNWSLWLDHFDGLWLAYTQAIPAPSYDKPDVSIYDHSKVAAAFAASLWRWYKEKQLDETATIEELLSNEAINTKQLLLIQGDFSGIQNFIFAEGSQTNKKAAKILRGRSFYVSLVSELAALKLLEALELPPTSQIMNAAGKFLIVAPNTETTVNKLNQVKQEIDSWFIKNTLGIAGLCFASNPVSRADLSRKNLPKVVSNLFASLEVAKLQRMNLTSDNAVSVLDVNYPHGECAWNRYLPADSKESQSSALSRDQIKIGEALVKPKVGLAILSAESKSLPSAEALKQTIFGYHVHFCEYDKIKDFKEVLSLSRFWDLSMPETSNDVIWNGSARRNINSYVPRVKDGEAASHLYDEDLDELNPGNIKTFSHLACEDRTIEKDSSTEKESLVGIKAIGCLKGDIDNLGLIFQTGLVGVDKESFSFARMVALSRQVNAFFSIYLPYLCKTEFPSMYTIFAGGDDFFFVGPWYQTQRFAGKIREKFSEYCACSPQLHFSAGIATVKPGIPIRNISVLAEEALEKAKQIDVRKDQKQSKVDPVADKNAVTVFGCTVKWSTWNKLRQAEEKLNSTKDELGLNNTYLYSLFYMCEQARKEKEENIPEAALWRSHLSYRTNRWITDNKKKLGNEADSAMQRILEVTFKPIEEFGGAFNIPLSNVFYHLREY